MQLLKVKPWSIVPMTLSNYSAIVIPSSLP